MTLTDQLVQDIIESFMKNPPEGLPRMSIRAMLEAGKRPIPCMVVHVDPDPVLVEPLDTTYEMTGHVDLLTVINADDDANDGKPLMDAREVAKVIKDGLDELDGEALGKTFLHLMEAHPAESVGDDAHALHRIPFEATVQPCE